MLLFGVSACGDDENPAPRGSLATGLTEYAPAAIAGRARELHPRYARLYVLWSAVQPRPGARFDWDAEGSGGFSVRAQVRAIHEAGFDPLVTFYSTPAWAARPAGGCEPPKANVNARAPRADALPDYRAMVESFLAMARREGLDVRHLSAWNEPNSGLFLAPQRQRCDPVSSPSRGAAQYAPIARALSAALDAAPGDQEAVVGEVSARSRRARSSAPSTSSSRPCPGTWRAAAAYGRSTSTPATPTACPRPSGASPRFPARRASCGSPRPEPARRKPGAPRTYDATTLRGACAGLDILLQRWWADPKVTAAFQYTLREDPNFPVGLASADLARTYPTFALWRAWGAREKPTDPPPQLPAACR